MRKITPLVVSGSSAIGKNAFASRLVKEHPDMFKLAPPVNQTQQMEQEYFQAEKENKIPIFQVNEVELAGSIKQKVGTANGLHIIPPNIETFRERLEKAEESTVEKINRTCEQIKTELNKAFESDLYSTEDFIVANKDFEKSYQQFKKRVFVMYKQN
ncbi:guanylate kinase (macronuclear) [Tetrahymena thermophila SB210]|uniref:Guanylate kinase n=1 Tax=Tetrahymena thermophila (strain SB210) TaxID=312017 RepID=I7M4E0_TETTS|nr:guanylate kinase [Tetrahymena thermophila SB210]EAS06300.1 guanylate kinase [Tetrahymena thermophila SB210]|eukprot:XP_001026545.1 guanylate kinase [Tetrahymena thermophila SB210]